MERIFHGLRSRDRAMLACFRRIEDFGPSTESVVLLGESGTGKEGLAEAVHLESGRKGRFVALNCGGLPLELVDSELFGHAEGAFTGARSAKRGAFRSAHEGTLFLDELGELPAEVQVKLLRVLERQRVRAVGEVEERPVDVRIVAATHRDLPEMVAEDRFREDLFHRLFVLPVEVPPLRERPDDVMLLARHFGSDLQFRPETVDALLAHSWPGNVRELRNVIARARLAAVNGIVGPEQLLFFHEAGPRGALARYEQRRIEASLRAHGGNRSRTAKALGIPRSTLNDRIRRRGIRL
ncbi:MAG: sigma 54-interacting transcriptional regulator [Myxococcota bacterium]